jgi:hypothetical protein
VPIERGNDCTHVNALKMPKQLCLVECNFCDKQFRVGSGKVVVFLFLFVIIIIIIIITLSSDE